MCLEVFVATDRPLPAVVGPDLSVVPCAAREPLSLPFVHQAAAHGGCGCGFAYAPPEPDPGLPDDILAGEHADYDASLRSVAALRALLESVAHAEVYAVWSGEGALPSVGRRTAAPAHFSGDAFTFVERELLTVRAA